jgi:hypothetical protein
VPERNNLPPEESDRRFFRKLAELRVACTAAKCSPGNPAKGAEDLVALVKERRSLSFAIESCERLATVVKELWTAVDPEGQNSSLYEDHIERLAFQVVLQRHNIPQQEVDEAKLSRRTRDRNACVAVM